VNRNALSLQAVGRWLAVCAVLAGLFAMHGLPQQGCPGGVEGPPLSMAHQAPTAAAADKPTLVTNATAIPISRPLRQSLSAIGADGQLGQMCVATPPSGWARLLALLMAVSILGLATALRSPTTVMHPDNQRRRAPPLTGSTLLRDLCVSRT
jgi:hypothetical protein